MGASARTAVVCSDYSASNLSVPGHGRGKVRKSALCSRSLTTRRMGEGAPKRPLRNAVARAAPMVMGALASSPERYRSIEILVDAPN